MLHSYSRIATSPPPTPARLPSWSPGELAATHEAYRAALRVIAPQTDDQTGFAETFAESWIATRDLIGAAAATGTDLHLAGWHLDDVATLRAVDNSTVLVGSDANQTVALVEALLHSARRQCTCAHDAPLAAADILVAEDHWHVGGLGDAVTDALSDADSEVHVRRLAVHTRPTPGHGARQLWRSGIDRTWIAAAGRDLLERVDSTVPR